MSERSCSLLREKDSFQIGALFEADDHELFDVLNGFEENHLFPFSRHRIQRYPSAKR